MKVFDIMSEHIVTVGLGEPVAAAARLLKQYNIGAVPVCDERGNLRGMITDRDIAVRCAALRANPIIISSERRKTSIKKRFQVQKCIYYFRR